MTCQCVCPLQGVKTNRASGMLEAAVSSVKRLRTSDATVLKSEVVDVTHFGQHSNS